MKIGDVSDRDLDKAVVRVNPNGWWYIQAAGEEWGYYDTREEAEAFLSAASGRRRVTR